MCCIYIMGPYTFFSLQHYKHPYLSSQEFAVPEMFEEIRDAESAHGQYEGQEGDVRPIHYFSVGEIRRCILCADIATVACGRIPVSGFGVKLAHKEHFRSTSVVRVVVGGNDHADPVIRDVQGEYVMLVKDLEETRKTRDLSLCILSRILWYLL